MRCVSQTLGLVIGLALFLLFSGSTGTAQNALTVCPRGCEFTKIQDAIDAATAGDTISVQPGFYRENLRMTKSLMLQGADMASVMMSDGAAPTIDIVGDPNAPLQVTIEGFTIVGTLNPQLTDVGIQSRFARVTISRNVITRHGSYGVRIVNGVATIRANTLTVNGGAIALGSPSGAITLTTIERNLITKNRKPLSGIMEGNGSISLLGQSGDAQVTENVITENEGDGLDLSLGPAFWTIARNTIASNTGAGVTLGSSVFGRIQIESNTISRNGGDGLFLKGGNRVFVFSNLIASNGQDGIRLDPSSSADIFLMDNRIREQKLWGIGGLIKACHPESADAKETLVGSIRGQDNVIPDKSEVGGNQRGDVCPEGLRFLKNK
ncbi:right-handed parallel beta-helix repeat-containing protein [Candidatus Acetothermia bacterium]|nr:right-handed parallel beta-helix repeat-containing protein [Candidatus Acetothermia bacterium]